MLSTLPSVISGESNVDIISGLYAINLVTLHLLLPVSPRPTPPLPAVPRPSVLVVKGGGRINEGGSRNLFPIP